MLPDAALGGYLARPAPPDPQPERCRPRWSRTARTCGRSPPWPRRWWSASATARRTGTRRYNAAVCVTGDGVLGRHRKVHQPPGEIGGVRARRRFAAFDTPAGRVGHADRLRQDVPGVGAVAGPGRRGDPRLPVGLADAVSPTGRRGWRRTGRPGCSTCTTRRGPPRTRSCSPRPTRPGRSAGMRFLGQAKVVGPGGDILARTWSKAGLAVADARREGGDRHGPGGCCTTWASCGPPATGAVDERPAVKIALLSYSTKPRGGVVHTLALAEALAAAGPGRDGLDAWAAAVTRGFFRPVDPRVTPAGRAVPRGGRRGGGPAHPALDRRAAGRVRRRGPTTSCTPRTASAPTPSAAASAPCTTWTSSPRRNWPPATSAPSSSRTRTCACPPRSPPSSRRAGASGPTVIPNGVDAARFAAAAGP